MFEFALAKIQDLSSNTHCPDSRQCVTTSHSTKNTRTPDSTSQLHILLQTHGLQTARHNFTFYYKHTDSRQCVTTSHSTTNTRTPDSASQLHILLQTHGLQTVRHNFIFYYKHTDSRQHVTTSHSTTNTRTPDSTSQLHILLQTHGLQHCRSQLHILLQTHGLQTARHNFTFYYKHTDSRQCVTTSHSTTNTRTPDSTS